MPYQSVRDRYVNDGAGVVPQPRLLIMLFDRLVADVQQALDALASQQPQQLAIANDRLCHAQAILWELHHALDKTIWDGAAQLDQVYLWIHSELVQANLKKDPKPVRNCLRLLTDLQQAWNAAYNKIGNQPLESFAPTGEPSA